MFYNENDLLQFVKLRLGHPYNPIEISDESILDLFAKRVNPIFSKYFPYRQVITIDTYDPTTGKFKIVESELFDRGRKLLSVSHVVNKFDANIPLIAYNNAYDYVNNTMMRAMTKQILTYNLEKGEDCYYFKVNNNLFNSVTLRFETTHSLDFSTVENNQIEVLEIIALAEISLALISTRSMYQSISSTVGEVNLNLDMLKENVEAYEKIKDDLTKVAVLSKRVPLLIA